MPQKESIESLAAHQASMAIYLSTGMLRELSRRLMAGGYAENKMCIRDRGYSGRLVFLAGGGTPEWKEFRPLSEFTKGETY